MAVPARKDAAYLLLASCFSEERGEYFGRIDTHLHTRFIAQEKLLGGNGRVVCEGHHNI